MTSHTAVATEIRRQIGPGALMSLGAHKLGYVNASVCQRTGIRGGLVFMARIMPITKAGARSSAVRNMRVIVELTGADLYRVTVEYQHRGDTLVHFARDGVYCDEIGRLMLALDWDGDEVLNPRLAA